MFQNIFERFVQLLLNIIFVVFNCFLTHLGNDVFRKFAPCISLVVECIEVP